LRAQIIREFDLMEEIWYFCITIYRC